MTSTRLALLAVLGVTTLLAFVLSQRANADTAVAARLRALRPGRSGAEEAARSGLIAVTHFAALGRLLMRCRVLPRTTVHEAEMLLASARLHGEALLAGFIGIKVLLLIGLPLLGWGLATLTGQPRSVALFAAVAGAVAAVVVPDVLLRRRRRARLAAIAGSLSDALDLLLICIDAGLPFEQALERVTREIAPVHPALAEELAVTVNELRIAPDRRAVLLDLGARLDLEFMRRLTSTLAQSLQLGAPLSRALRLLAQELRREELVRLEARVARLPVLLTIPMVMFIMPTVMLVVCGPAILQVIRNF